MVCRTWQTRRAETGAACSWCWQVVDAQYHLEAAGWSVVSHKAPLQLEGVSTPTLTQRLVKAFQVASCFCVVAEPDLMRCVCLNHTACMLAAPGVSCAGLHGTWAGALYGQSTLAGHGGCAHTGWPWHHSGECARACSARGAWPAHGVHRFGRHLCQLCVSHLHGPAVAASTSGI